ncbi:sulfatase family protein [Novipirellula sp. SH528]|uniref:sulfatase family protein n=1 Tax=Novipirellula sp. SH528 TaxID=3454466 RepID=UPI003FA0883A
MKQSFLLFSVFITVVTCARGDVVRPNIIVFYTDDHGYADLSCQGVFDDIKTPNVDALARSGVLATHGYSTAPQCIPSRAGLLVGKFQSRFGVEANGQSLDGFDRELTIAERLQSSGYITAQFGKWHLGTGPKITEHGFKHVFNQNAQRPFAANITLDGTDREMSNLPPTMYHVDGCSKAAAALIERYKDDPFFLYVAYRAPHVPLDAPQKYLDRFPGKMPERRRQALAMLSAVDDGVGLITDTLAKHQLTQKTLIFYIGDNGAPLKIHKLDAPGGGPGWDGSLNDPLNGEKGMLSEGGMHVPFVIAWPGKIPAGQIYNHPVSALDVAATAAEIANLETKPGDLDGINLIPHLTGQLTTPPHDALMWRWTAQSAIREGNWKLLRGGDREYLYDLSNDIEEQHNVLRTHPEIATRLRGNLSAWASELSPPGLATQEMSKAASDYFDFYLDGKPAAPIRGKSVSTPTGKSNVPWIVRSGEMKTTAAGVQIVAGKSGKKQKPFITRAGLNLQGPVSVIVVVKNDTPGDLSISWRDSGDKDFTPEKRVRVAVAKSDDWQTVETQLPGKAKVIHVRVQVPSGVTTIKSIELNPKSGKPATLTE